MNQLLDGVRPDEQFVDGNAAVKARPVALIAADTPEELNCVELGQTGRTVSRSLAFEQVIVFFPGRMIPFLASRADPFAEPGREDAEHGIGEVEWVAAEIQEPDDGFDGTIGMERAEDEVAGQRRFDGYVGRFLVPHFADHDDVRVRRAKTRAWPSQRSVRFWGGSAAGASLPG